VYQTYWHKLQFRIIYEDEQNHIVFNQPEDSLDLTVNLISLLKYDQYALSSLIHPPCIYT